MKKTPKNETRAISATTRNPVAAKVGHRTISAEELDAIFSGIGQKLREGRSSEAERVLTEAIKRQGLKPDDLANLKRLLAFTFETVGRYKASLEAIKPYEDEDLLGRLSTETQVRITTQLAISFNNLGDHPKAVTLLKATLENAKDNGLEHLLGNIDIGLARVYRKLNEFAICRDYAKG